MSFMLGKKAWSKNSYDWYQWKCFYLGSRCHVCHHHCGMHIFNPLLLLKRKKRSLCAFIIWSQNWQKFGLRPFYPALKIWTRMFYFNLCTQICGCKFKFLVYKDHFRNTKKSLSCLCGTEGQLTLSQCAHIWTGSGRVKITAAHITVSLQYHFNKLLKLLWGKAVLICQLNVVVSCGFKLFWS